jgi:AAA ATPase domain
VGRELELGRLLALIGDIHNRGGALVVRGEAGIGKSALLAAAAARARSAGVEVVPTTAVESETRLPFAGLHEVLLPFLDRLDGLPDVQRHGLEMALGLAPREAVPDIFLVGLAALGLLAEAATKNSILLIVEDAHWIDRSSGMVLGFVARRLALEPVLMWFAVRAGVTSDVDDAGLPEFELRGLSEEASTELLETRAPDLRGDLKQQILGEAVGNPLALIELPIAAKGLPLDGQPLPLTARLEQAFAARFGELDVRERALLLVAALGS